MAARYELLPTIIHFAQRIGIVNRLALFVGLVFFSTAQAATTSGDASNGALLWDTYHCSGCHNTPPAQRQLNAANASNVIDYQITNGMLTNPPAAARNDIAAYIATQISDPNPANLAIPYNSVGTVFKIPDISLNTGFSNTNDTFTSIVTVSGPSKGTVTFNKLNATYTPTTGQTGADEFTYNATGPAGTSNIRKVTLLIADPPPVVTNPGTMTAASGSAFSYQIVATNSPTSYSIIATGLTLSVSGSGLVTGTLPTVTSPTDYSVTLSATNAGGTGSQTFTLTVNPPAPVVTNPGSMTAASGAFSYQIIATNSPTSYNVTATGLTLSVDSSGLVTGTLPGVGTPTNYSVTLDASNGTGTGSQTFTLTVNPAGAPVTTNPGSMTAASGSAFSYQIVATNSPTSYSVTAAGLTLSVNGSGLVTGTLPTVTSPTNYSVTLSATNAIGTGSQTFTLTVNPPAPVVTNPGTMSATSGSAFSYQIIATNSPTSYSVTAAGLTLSVNGSGLVTGTLPTIASSTNYSVTLDATNAAGTDSQTFTLTVNPLPPPVVSNPGPQTAASGSAFSYQIIATNSPTSYSVTAAGLTLSVNGSGLVTGALPAVTSATNYSITLDASSVTGTGSQTFTLTVNPPTPVVSNPGTITTSSGAAFNYQIVATNSPTSYGVTAAGLTLSVNGSGLVTGTVPTVTSPTNYSVTLDASNSAGTGSQTFTLTVNPPSPAITNPGTLTATSGAAFSYQIIATNSPTSYSVTATGLALSVNGSGLVTGTLPTVTSPTDYSVTLNATNVSGTTSQTFTLTVNPQAPIAAPAAMTVAVNASATLDLALSITGSVTSINIVSAAAHGTTIVSGTQVTYTPNHDYFGSDTFSYVAIGSGGSSVTAVVNVTIVGRPDPTTDARVTGLLDGQIATAQRFAKAQIANFQQRLEKLHRVSPAITASDLAALVEHGSNPSNNLAPGLSTDNVGFATYKNNPWYFPTVPENIPASGSPQLANLIVGALTTSSINLAMLADSDNTAPGALEKTEIWGAGNLRYGTRNQSSGGVIDFSTDGISIGADRRIDEALSLGMGMGYARDKSTIGTDGTGTASHARSIAAYGSYLLTPTLFMDGLIGYGKLNFNTTRYVQPINDFAYGQREGNQIFASLAAGYEYRTDGMLLSPYGRLDFATEHLYATTETGAGLYALNYASQTSHASQVSGGIRTELSHHAHFGWILPHARIEYQRNTEEGQQASIAYADLFNGPRYEVASAIVNTNSVVLGIGSNFILHSGFKIGISYQSSHSTGQEKTQAVNFSLSKELGS